MNYTFENTTLDSDFGSGDSGFISNFTSTPPDTSDGSISTSTIIIICLGLLCSCIISIPLFVDCFGCPNGNRNNRRSSCCCCCCGSNHQLSDIERNNRYNRQISFQNEKPLKQKVVIIELTEVIVADPFDATEKCSICLEDISEGEKLGSLPCGHKHFHQKCIDEWLNVSGNKTCPLCRNMVV
jgi:hypothetical protein